MGLHKTLALAVLVAVCCTLRLTDGDGIKLPDQVDVPAASMTSQAATSQSVGFPPVMQVEERNRQGKNLFDFVGLGTGPMTDPYLARTNANCLNGELAECFKSQAIGTFSEFFNKHEYQ